MFKAYGLRIKSEIFFEEFIICNNLNEDYDIEIVYEENDKVIEENILRGARQCVNDNNVWLHVDKVATFRITNGNKISVNPCIEGDMKGIKLYIVGTCMGYLLFQRKILAIHGGALEYNNKAMVLVGESGAGKSTLTTALRLRGYGFLTDDICAVDASENLMINPGYPGQKLCEDCMDHFKYEKKDFNKVELTEKSKYNIPVYESFIDKKVELGAIFEISIGDVSKVEITEVLGSEKLDLLFNNIYSLKWVKHLGINPEYFKNCIKLIRLTHIYKIVRPSKGFTINDQIEAIENLINAI